MDISVLKFANRDLSLVSSLTCWAVGAPRRGQGEESARVDDIIVVCILLECDYIIAFPDLNEPRELLKPLLAESASE